MAGKGPLANIFRAAAREEHLKDLPQTPGRVAREGRIESRVEKAKKRLSERSRAAGTVFGG